jgi:hypothetical protein
MERSDTVPWVRCDCLGSDSTRMYTPPPKASENRNHAGHSGGALVTSDLTSPLSRATVNLVEQKTADVLGVARHSPPAEFSDTVMSDAWMLHPEMSAVADKNTITPPPLPSARSPHRHGQPTSICMGKPLRPRNTKNDLTTRSHDATVTWMVLACRVLRDHSRAKCQGFAGTGTHHWHCPPPMTRPP